MNKLNFDAIWNISVSTIAIHEVWRLVKTGLADVYIRIQFFTFS